MATPRGFSQPPTSFIASEHLGIHHTPLVAYLPKSLVRPPLSPDRIVKTRNQGPDLSSSLQARKTSFAWLLTPRSSPPPPSRRRGLLEESNSARTLSQQKLNYPSYALFKERFLLTSEGKALSGADRVRTDDIQLAKLALSQLSYSPGKSACLWTLARVTNFLSSERHGGPRWT